MRLSPIPSPQFVLEKVRSSDRDPSRREERRKSDDEKGKEKPPVFEEDPQLSAHGFSASAEGNGPGLRVTLKDGQGAFVRQFTGEEFLRLRESAAPSGRGRLIDKKL